MAQCPNCGETVAPADAFCEECGYNLQQGSRPAAQQSTSSGYQLPASIGSRRTLKWVIAGVAAAIVASVACGAFVALRLMEPPQAETVQVVITATSAPQPEASPTGTEEAVEGEPIVEGPPEPTPTLRVNTPPGKILRPGEGWYKDGLTLELTNWDRDQTLTFTVYNDTEGDITLDQLETQFSAVSPDGEADEAITLHEPDVSGIVQEGEQEPFQVAVSVDPEARAEWSYFVVNAEQFGVIEDAQWELEIVNTPTPVPTDTPVPTRTPIPSPTPIPDTPAGTILEMGEWWNQDGVSLVLFEPTLEPDRILFRAAFQNRTEHELSIKVTADNFSVTNNRGQVYPVGHSKYPCTVPGGRVMAFSGQLPPGEEVRICKDSYLLHFEGDTTDEAISEIIITVNLSRIKNAKWRVPVYH